MLGNTSISVTLGKSYYLYGADAKDDSYFHDISGVSDEEFDYRRDLWDGYLVDRGHHEFRCGPLGASYRNKAAIMAWAIPFGVVLVGLVGWSLYSWLTKKDEDEDKSQKEPGCWDRLMARPVFDHQHWQTSTKERLAVVVLLAKLGVTLFSEVRRKGRSKDGQAWLCQGRSH